MSIPEISVHDLKILLDAKADIFILDVRNEDEYAQCNLKGHLIPLPELPKRLDELNRDQHIIVHCLGGGRSARATAFLLQSGFKQVSNLTGGIKAWAHEIDHHMKIA